MSHWTSRAYDTAYGTAVAPGQVRKSAQARWDSEHMITASCRLTRSEMERLRRAVAKDGITVYALLRYMIDVYLRKSGY